jgi:hypothetical protein
MGLLGHVVGVCKRVLRRLAPRAGGLAAPDASQSSTVEGLTVRCDRALPCSESVGGGPTRERKLSGGRVLDCNVIAQTLQALQ